MSGESEHSSDEKRLCIVRREDLVEGICGGVEKKNRKETWGDNDTVEMSDRESTVSRSGTRVSLERLEGP